MKILSSAIRRGGNHAMANWLLPHINDSTIYVHNGKISNYISHDGKPNVMSSLFVPFNSVMIPVYMKPFKGKQSDSDGFVAPLLPGSVKFLNDIQHHVLFGIENITPEVIYSDMSDAQHPGEIFVQTLRSPWNNLASLMKYKGMLLPFDKFAETWKKFAREHVGETNYLSQVFDKTLFVSFDLWFSSKEYRIQISKELEMNHTDFGLNYVSGQGGGSSFDNMQKNENAQDMKVKERWLHYANNEQFREILNDSELIELSIEIFGEFPLL
jgi:hypothetical protein